MQVAELNAQSIQRGRIYTVSELTHEIKALLEESFPFVWICGEISNISAPVSGHFYFTLKDANAQLAAIMFRGQNRQLKFRPEDGMKVTCLGRVSVYPPRGSYQILIEYMEPAGIGALQIAFEQLKARLQEEGLFDQGHKKSIPFLPRKICVITSPTGAVVHDIVKIVNRRYPLFIDIIPVKVQGEGAEQEIVSALNLANSKTKADVIILARGGGSLEDLHAFNSEAVARAIFQSDIPVISAVGHEIDVTISDFTADLRAPTPSAAAELAVPVKAELQMRSRALQRSLSVAMRHCLSRLTLQLNQLKARVAHPKKRIQDFRLRLADLTRRMNVDMTNSHIRRNRERFRWRQKLLYKNDPAHRIDKLKTKLNENITNLSKLFNNNYRNNRFRFTALFEKLFLLNPLAILNRGYSITKSMPDGGIVKDADLVAIHQKLHITLARGVLICRVEGKQDHDSKNI